MGISVYPPSIQWTLCKSVEDSTGLVWKQGTMIVVTIMSLRMTSPVETRARLGRVQHPLAGLDRCTRVTLNAVLWVEMAKWPWRSRSMPTIFNTSCKNPKMHIWCKFGDSSSNPSPYRADKLKFLEFWVKIFKMTLKVKVNDLHFQYQLRVSRNASLVLIWWF